MATFLICVLFASFALVRTADIAKMNQESELSDDRIRAAVSEMIAKQVSMYDRRIAELENQQRWQNRRISTLEARVKRQQKYVSDLTRKMYESTHNENVPKEDATDPTKTIFGKGSDHTHATINTSEEMLFRQFKHNSSKRVSPVDNVRRRMIDAPENVAFTVYLDHNYTHMGVGHTVKFNRIHLNDGNGYNTHTGAFTVPETGVYLFTFHWSSHYRETILELMVDDVQQAAAITSPFSNYHTMAGQTVIIRANAGQSVWVEAKLTRDGEIYLAGQAQYATFSGIYLY